MAADPRRTNVTRLLEEVQRGNGAAHDELFAVLYQDLHELARRQRQRWRGDYTLNTTALVHEAYLKLADGSRLGAESRAHFFAVAAKAMRHILCNYARDRRTQKRGAGREDIPLDELDPAASPVPLVHDEWDGLIALDDALRRLERLDTRQGQVIECRFFGGLTIDETASAIGVSPRTVQRDWALAQAWLHRELRSLV